MASKTRYKSRSPTPAVSIEEVSIGAIPHTLNTTTTASSHGPTTITRNLVVGSSAPHSFTSQAQFRTYDRRYSSPRSPYMTHSSPHLRHTTIPDEQEKYTTDNASIAATAASIVREADYSDFCQSKPPTDIDYSSTDSLVSNFSADTAMPEWVPPSHYSPQMAASTLPMFIEPTYHNSHLQHMEQTAGKPTPLQPSFPGPQFPTPIPSIPAIDERYRPRQLSIQSILSSPCSAGNKFGNGQVGIKRKKGEEEENEAKGEVMKEINGLEGIEDPDVRLAAEALGDLRADFNHSGRHSRSPSITRPLHPSHLHLSTSTPSSSTSSSTNPTSLNSPLSPPTASLPHPQYSPSVSPTPLSDTHNHSPQAQQKPLIDLLSESSPIINTVVQRSAAAYSGTKNYSPKFRYAAEIGEKFMGVSGNLVGKKIVGDKLEGWVRSKLSGSVDQGKEDQKVHHMERKDSIGSNGGASGNGHIGKKKKRKMSNGELDVNGHTNGNGCALQPRPGSNHHHHHENGQHAAQPQPNWQTRMMITTSGLTVAMSEESFKSLQFCFSWLRVANAHLSKMIETLQQMLAEYEASLNSNNNNNSNNSNSPRNNRSGGGGSAGSASHGLADQGVLCKVLPGKYENQRQKFLKAIETVKEDVLSTIKKVISVVDDYAGGALTGEARSMVKRQLLLLPRRISYVLAKSTVGANYPAVQGVVKRLTAGSDHDSGAKSEAVGNGAIVEADGNLAEKGQGQQVDPRVNANKVLLIAKEGFEMMQNVTRLVEETLISAEEWCEKLGKRPGNMPAEAVRAQGQVTEAGHGDVEMGGGEQPGRGEMITNRDVDEGVRARQLKFEQLVRVRDGEGDVEMKS